MILDILLYQEKIKWKMDTWIFNSAALNHMFVLFKKEWQKFEKHILLNMLQHPALS